MDSNELEAVKLPNELEIAKLWDLILKFIGADRNRIILLLEKSIDFMSENSEILLCQKIWNGEHFFFSEYIDSKQANEPNKKAYNYNCSNDFGFSPISIQQTTKKCINHQTALPNGAHFTCSTPEQLKSEKRHRINELSEQNSSSGREKKINHSACIATDVSIEHTREQQRWAFKVTWSPSTFHICCLDAKL